MWLATLVLVGGMLVSLPVNHARAATSQLMTLDPSSLPATLDSQTTIAGQDVVTTWTDTSGDTFTVAGPAGSVLTLGTDTDGIPYAEVSPPLPSTSAITGDQAIAQAIYVLDQRTIYPQGNNQRIHEKVEDTFEYSCEFRK